MTAGTRAPSPRAPATIWRALGKPARGLRIGILREGFGHPESDPAVTEKVRRRHRRSAGAGADAEEISIPWHLDGPHVWSGIILEGAAEMMLKGFGVGNNVHGYYPLSMQEAFARGMGTRINDVSPTVKLVLMLGEYMHRNYHGRYHSKAQNLRVLLRRAYDEALEKFDVLAMPTIPFTATPIPPADCAAEHYDRHRAQHAGEYLLIRCLRTSGLHRAMRPSERSAGRPDAGRPPFRGSDPDPAGGGDRSQWRLEAELAGAEAKKNDAGVRFALHQFMGM